MTVKVNTRTGKEREGHQRATKGSKEQQSKRKEKESERKGKKRKVS